MAWKWEIYKTTEKNSIKVRNSLSLAVIFGQTRNSLDLSIKYPPFDS